MLEWLGTLIVRFEGNLLVVPTLEESALTCAEVIERG